MLRGSSPLDTQDGGAGSFYITEANIASDFARIGTGNCFVGFEPVPREDAEAQITGITPAVARLHLKQHLTDLTNGTNVQLTRDLSSVDTIPKYLCCGRC